MNFNLRMLNCWIGLCRGVAPLPQDIVQAGYSDKNIEHEFRTAESERCKPELIIASRKDAHAALFEWKDGRTIKLDQLQRYAGVTQEDLVERAYLISDECRSHDSILLVKDAHVENTVELLDRETLPFPVVGAFPGRFKTVRGKIAGDVLSKILVDFPCKWELAPVSYVPFDRDSPIAEVATQVVALIVQRLLRRDSKIRSIDLCSEVCPLFSAMSSDARNAVESRISDVFAAAAKHEFAQYLEYKQQSHGSSQLRVTRNPFQIHDDKRSRAFKRMKRLEIEFIEALKCGCRPRPDPTLFDTTP